MPHKAWTLVGRAQRRVSMTRPDYEDVSAKLMLGNRKSWPRSCLLQPKFWQLFHSIGRVDAGNTTDVRFGSKADISQCNRHVRFTLESGHAAKGTVAHRLFNLVHCCRAAIGAMAS